MSSDDEDYVYDEESGEWMPASELAARQAAASRAEVRDAVGNVLADGDQVALIKDLEVKGAGQTLKQGTLIPSIRLTGDAQEIDCRYPGIKGLVLRAEFVRKTGLSLGLEAIAAAFGLAELGGHVRQRHCVQREAGRECGGRQKGWYEAQSHGPGSVAIAKPLTQHYEFTTVFPVSQRPESLHVKLFDKRRISRSGR